MNFPWWRMGRPPPPAKEAPTADVPSADEALRNAREQKAEAEAKWPLVRWLSGELQMHSNDNHFAEMVQAAMKRRDK